MKLRCKKLVGLILVTVVLNSHPILAGKLQDILQQHSSTLGDTKAWKDIHNLTYTLHIKEPSFTVKGIYYVTRSGKMRIDIFAGEQHVFTEAYDGTQGWQWNSGDSKAKIIGAKLAAALLHGIQLPGHIYTLLDMQDNGHKLMYIGEEKWQQRSTNLLKLTLSDGHQKYFVLDKKSGQLLASRDKRAFHPDIDNTEVMIETRKSDVREYFGTRRSFTSENWDLTNQKSLGITRVTKLIRNSVIKNSYFEIDSFVRIN